jgi:hypothetical protein
LPEAIKGQIPSLQRLAADAAAERARLTAHPTAPQEANEHLVAHGLVWVLRGIALLAAIWGLIDIGNALEASRVAREAAKKAQAGLGGPDQGTKPAEAATTGGVFKAVISTSTLVAAFLAFAEVLRLGILVENNTRRMVKPQMREEETSPRKQ